jgi:hypothetical protein
VYTELLSNNDGGGGGMRSEIYSKFMS